ncbi:MAG: winged helix-turn-helix domain-containing protein, partial [Coriobacteriia bacterium]|nr:winged helix-turn-helix domain-containing protein [Coriobacteriia bacterium]
MPIPEQVKFHQVVLRSLQYGGELTLKEVQNYVAAEFDLTAADKKYRTKGGNVVYAMRISSSLSLLKEAGFITSPR